MEGETKRNKTSIPTLLYPARSEGDPLLLAGGGGCEHLRANDEEVVG